jgi:hypothetical protein
MVVLYKHKERIYGSFIERTSWRETNKKKIIYDEYRENKTLLVCIYIITRSMKKNKR